MSVNLHISRKLSIWNNWESFARFRKVLLQNYEIVLLGMFLLR